MGIRRDEILMSIYNEIDDMLIAYLKDQSHPTPMMSSEYLGRQINNYLRAVKMAGWLRFMPIISLEKDSVGNLLVRLYHPKTNEIIESLEEVVVGIDQKGLSQ